MGLGLTPMRQEFVALPGKAYTGVLVLSNSAASAVRIRTEILDFFVDSEQTPQFLPNVAAESEYSCRQWVSVNPMETEVAARGQLTVRYTVRTPPDAAERSYHCALGFVSMPGLGDAPGLQVRTAVRVVATLYPIVGGPSVKGSIADMAIEPAVNGGRPLWRGIVTLENSGLMLFRPSGSVELVDAGGKVVETLSIVSFPVLPRRQQRFLLPFKKPLENSRYTMRARIDFGAEVQEAAVEVSAEPRKL